MSKPLSPILEFLSDLEKNNNREWFESNKSRYQDARSALEDLVADMIDRMADVDPDLGMLEPKKCIFRIYRDVRFSKDKTPYKTNMSVSLKAQGRKSPYAGYFLSLKPGEVFVAGGIWHPEPKNLAQIRQEIDYNGQVLEDLFTQTTFKKAFVEMKGEKLKRPPKGYEPDNPRIEWLKHKDFLLTSQVPDEKLGQNFAKNVVGYFSLMQPFNQFLNMAIGE